MTGSRAGRGVSRYSTSRLMRFFLFALALFVTDAAAQDSKDPGTAQLYSFVVPGGGQFYSGETLKGAVLVTGVVGGLTHTVRHHGFLALYTGLTPTLILLCPCLPTRLAGYR